MTGPHLALFPEMMGFSLPHKLRGLWGSCTWNSAVRQSDEVRVDIIFLTASIDDLHRVDGFYWDALFYTIEVLFFILLNQDSCKSRKTWNHANFILYHHSKGAGNRASFVRSFGIYVKWPMKCLIMSLFDRFLSNPWCFWGPWHLNSHIHDCALQITDRDQR